MVYRTNSTRLHVLLQKIACLVGASLLVLSFLFVAAQPSPRFVSAAVVDGNTIFVGCLSSGIKKLAIDGSGTVTSTSSNYGLYLAASGGYVYSTGLSAVWRVNTDGTGSVKLFDGSGTYPSYLRGMAVDSQYIYFGNDYSKQIGRANLDGTSVDYNWANLTSSLNYAATDLSRASNFLFFGEGGNVSGKRIGRIGIDGTGPITLATDADAGGGVAGVTSDNNYVYWVDFRSGEIGRVGQDGSGATDNFITGLSNPWDIEVTSSHIYVLENGTVVRFNLDGTGKTTIQSTGCSRGIAVESSQFSDVTAPTLSSSVPADNATGVGLSSNIALTFSETVTAVAGKNIVIKKSDGTTVETISATSAQVTFSGSTATVNPASNFDYLTGYYVLIDAGAFVDAAANGYAGISSTTALNFVSAADTTAPTLSSSTPADNATGVATASNISLVFSENVTAVSGKNIVIKKSDDTTVETISVTDGGRISVSGSTVTIDPTAAFQYSSSYYVLIDAGAFRDSASNAYAGISSSTALNFSVVADTATTSTSTTTIPSSTSSTIVGSAPTTTVVVAGVTATTSTVPASALLPVAGGVTTTTVSVSVTKPSVTPTTAPRSVLSSNVLPMTTTTTTSSTSTSTTLPPVVAPQAPVASPGSATALIGGKKVQMSVVRGNNSLEISSASIQMKLQVVDKAGSTVPLDADGNAVLSQDSLVKYSITGAEPGADLEAWLFSEPFKLGTVIVGEDGKVSGLLPVNSQVPAGDHRLVFKTRTATGDDATVSVGVIVGETGGGVSIGLLIFGTLIAAVMAGLILPATRRRRKTREAVDTRV
ncbi:MAG: hypothetical protein EXQ61_02630 [Ilumatobacteraceae bacterium]|nr:hypothetical protein [Ilumatobacteraceae bacterium]